MRVKRGFGLLELIIVLGILAVLASISIFGIRLVQRNGRDAQRVDATRLIKGAIDDYYLNRGSFPDKSLFKYRTSDNSWIIDEGGEDINIKMPSAIMRRAMSKSSPNSTLLCYRKNDNGTYALGVQKENGSWIQLGTAQGQSCNGSDAL